MKLEINYIKKAKTPQMHRAKQHSYKLSMDQWANKSGNQTIHGDKWKQKHNSPKFLGHSKSGSKREAHNNIGLLPETRITSNKQFKLTTRETRKRTSETKS